MLKTYSPAPLALFAALGLLISPLAYAGAGAGAPIAVATGPVSFRNDVMAVLSKAGCNMGTCHGNKYGKGGFKLSLRGQDPETDLLTLTRDLFGRRVDPLDPDDSLVLLKPTTQISHEGGLRFRKESPEYAILRRWIAGGLQNDATDTPRLERLDVSPTEQILIAPADRVQLKVEATFSDGTRRDVTSLTVYDVGNTLATVTTDGLVESKGPGETTVLVRFLQKQAPVRLAFVPARPDFVWKKPPVNNYIDEEVFNKLRGLRMNPSELSSDTVFLRRASLDLLGLLPTAAEARAFLADKRTDKRAKLIDQLMDRPEFADFWALQWADVLRNEEKSLDRKGVQDFYHWIRQAIADNKPVDQFVREIISARGSTYANPAANFHRALRDPVSRAEATAQLFMGVRLQCAQCHNHPFDRWTQDDYYGWAGIFARVQYKVIKNVRNDNLDKHEFIGEQVVYMSREGEVNDPRNGKPSKPKFLGAAGQGLDEDSDRLDELAGWLTSADNTLFVKAQVNRIWFHLMGRGIVDPVDDFRPTNPPSHPALLDALAKDFVAHKFDLRFLVRFIMNSRAYQLSSEPNPTNVDDVANYSRCVPRRLSAEQLLDAQFQVTGVQPQFNGYPVGLRAGQLPAIFNSGRRREQKLTSMDKMLTLFGRPERLLACECERSGETTMNQAFQLISGPAINDILTRTDNRLGGLVASGKGDAALLDELYWTALTRPPTARESAESARLMAKATDRRAALEDITWSLINAKEFILRQ
jgi:hypothetical protein